MTPSRISPEHQHATVWQGNQLVWNPAPESGELGALLAVIWLAEVASDAS